MVVSTPFCAIDVPTRPLIVSVVLMACSGPATALPPGADAARSFRPVSALFFLPNRPTPQPVEQAALVPDSKIEWDLRVTAKTLGLGGVDIDVRDQTAQLAGTVPTEEARHTMLEAARRTAGVKAVTDLLEVRP